MAIKKNLLTEKWLKTIKTMSDEQKGLADKRIWAYILIGILLFLSTFFINGNGCRAPSNKTRIETFPNYHQIISMLVLQGTFQQNKD